MTAPRMIAVWCPDWPVTAAGADPAEPVAVFVANRVVACSHPARAEGVRRGQRRREAQARCPQLRVLARDEAAEARAFEPVVVALESIAPGVEIVRPGLALIGARGPTRYFGSEDGVLVALSRAIAAWASDVQLGVADGAFAAEQAARQGVVVAAGGSPEFLAGLPIAALGRPVLADLLRRLGIGTLGDFAALPARDVLARFGPDGSRAHRHAAAREDRPVAARRPPAELDAVLDLDAAIDRVDTMAFTARGTVERFIDTLAAHGLACSCFELQLCTDRGEQTVRRWRHTGVLTPVDVVDRLRWQLEAWQPGSEVTRLRLIPVETVPVGAHQQGLWGGAGDGDERARRALSRVQTLLGPGSVLVPIVQGGRTPAERTRYVPWGDDPAPRRSPVEPWPGRLPAPAPSVLLDPPRPVQVLDAAGIPVRVTDTGAVPAAPTRLVDGAQRPVPITSWAGPWPLDERWWDAAATTRVALLQLVDVRGRAYLASYRLDGGGRWTLDAVYD
ncbi:MAG: DNA polymerase Y family protein [Jatrophihabitantaceae bacterium]